MNKKYLYWGMGVALIIYLSFDIVTKIAFERVSSHILGTKVFTSTIKTNIISGKFQVKNLKICNPGKFKEPYLFEADEVDLTLSLWSLLTETIEIDNFKVISAHIIYELDPELSIQDNIDIIKKNIKNILNLFFNLKKTFNYYSLQTNKLSIFMTAYFQKTKNLFILLLSLAFHQ